MILWVLIDRWFSCIFVSCEKSNENVIFMMEDVQFCLQIAERTKYVPPKNNQSKSRKHSNILKFIQHKIF